MHGLTFKTSIWLLAGSTRLPAWVAADHSVIYHAQPWHPSPDDPLIKDNASTFFCYSTLTARHSLDLWICYDYYFCQHIMHLIHYNWYWSIKRCLTCHVFVYSCNCIWWIIFKNLVRKLEASRRTVSLNWSSFGQIGYTVREFMNFTHYTLQYDLIFKSIALYYISEKRARFSLLNKQVCKMVELARI